MKLLEQNDIKRDIFMAVYDGRHLASDIDAMGSDKGLLNAFLDEVAEAAEAMPSVLRVLLARKDDHSPSPWFGVSTIDCFLKRGFNVSRIRPLTPRLKNYRIIYATHCQQDADDFYLLAVVRKKQDMGLPAQLNDPLEYNYEPNHCISKRVVLEYQQDGLPVIC